MLSCTLCNPFFDQLALCLPNCNAYKTPLPRQVVPESYGWVKQTSLVDIHFCKAKDLVAYRIQGALKKH